MSNYTKEELQGKVKKDLIEIAKKLNLDTSGNRAALMDRIFIHKPSFEEMVNSAPVSKDGDLTISVEQITNKVNTEVDTVTPEKEKNIIYGVDVNDPYPEPEIEDEKKSETKTENKEKSKIEAEAKIAEITNEAKINDPPVDYEKMIPVGTISENTAEDILKNWQNTIQNFYRKNSPGIAPTRPAGAASVAKELGIPNATNVLSAWQAAIISRLRPVRGIAPAPPHTVKDMIQIIKSL